MSKSADAFRTISEVADWLGIQAHVLRFWESKFTQVRPVKRAGGRRYYRPNDMLLLGGIKQLLHEDGLTIKGVQKILREEGMGHVAAMSPPLDELTQSLLEETPPTPFIEAPPEEKGVVLNFEQTPTKTMDAEQAQPEEPTGEKPAQDSTETELTEAVAAPVAMETAQDTATETSPEKDIAAETPAVEPETESVVAEPQAAKPVDEPAPTNIEETAIPQEPAPEPDPVTAPLEATESQSTPAPEVAELADANVPVAQAEPALEDSRSQQDAASEAPAEAAAPKAEETATATATLPAFLRRSMPDQPPPSGSSPIDAADTVEAAPQEIAPAPVEPEAPKPRIIDIPAFAPEHEIAAQPAILTVACHAKQLTTAQARQIAPLLSKLEVLRDSMATTRNGATNTGAND